MSRACQISNKKMQRGNNVSHANNRTKKESWPNLQVKRLFDTETGKWVRLRVSTRILRTIDKKGLAATLKDHNLTIDALK
ncbi:MAG: 50S ribosomal protein L28 [Deltaproteobacteria bacterium]|nr:50S ribosomal protein L28 [Deltaproteobacteria bacterium]